MVEDVGTNDVNNGHKGLSKRNGCDGKTVLRNAKRIRIQTG